uniref:ABC-2 type transporter transmembrane domain-containing protein n=1 Tax=Amphimedon queenslandica TaxID=400682 RepID=A0A1X7UXY7_AMPQE
MTEKEKEKSDLIGAIFFIVMNQIFGNLSAIDLFIRQKHIFIHENASRFYRVSSYFIAKVLCDIIPMRVLPLCIFTSVTYFMMGFQVEVDKFYIYLLGLICHCCLLLCLLGQCGVTVAGLANLLVALTYVVQMLFGGVLLTLDTIPVLIRWLQCVSLFRYSIEAIVVNKIDGLYFNQTISPGVYFFPAPASLAFI